MAVTPSLSIGAPSLGAIERLSRQDDPHSPWCPTHEDGVRCVLHQLEHLALTVSAREDVGFDADVLADQRRLHRVGLQGALAFSKNVSS